MKRRTLAEAEALARQAIRRRQRAERVETVRTRLAQEAARRALAPRPAVIRHLPTDLASRAARIRRWGHGDIARERHRLASDLLAAVTDDAASIDLDWSLR